MAHIEDRWEKLVSGQRIRTDRHGKGHRWRARYLDPDGRECARTFSRKQDAERFLLALRAINPVDCMSIRRPVVSPWRSTRGPGRQLRYTGVRLRRPSTPTFETTSCLCSGGARWLQ